QVAAVRPWQQGARDSRRAGQRPPHPQPLRTFSADCAHTDATFSAADSLGHPAARAPALRDVDLYDDEYDDTYDDVDMGGVSTAGQAADEVEAATNDAVRPARNVTTDAFATDRSVGDPVFLVACAWRAAG